MTPPGEANSEDTSQFVYTSTTASTAKLDDDDDGNIEDCELKIEQSDQHQFKCENNGTSLKLCNYEIIVGITKMPENATHLEAVEFLKAKKLLQSINGNQSKSMEIILQSVGQEIWLKKHNKTVPVKVPPHTRFILRQVVVTCGPAYEIRTPNTNLQALALPAQYNHETGGEADGNGDSAHSSFSRESESFENWQGTDAYVFDVSQSYENDIDYESKEKLVNDEGQDFDYDNWDSGRNRPKLQQQDTIKKPNTQSVSSSHGVYLRSGIIAHDKNYNASTTLPRFNILIVICNYIGSLLIFKVF